MKRFLSVFSLLLVLVFVQQSFAQPSVRDGWPLDYGPAGQMASLIEPNPLSVGVTSDGTRIIASATNFQVRILDIDGSLLQDVNLNGAVPDPAGANYLAGGPVIGDVDGDGEVEVVVALRAANGRTRAIAVIELDGTINSTISQGWSLANVDISSLVMENMDDDNALEIVFFCDDQLHVIDNDGTDMTGFPWTISRGQGYAAPAILPAEFNDGTPIIVWTSMDNNIHAQEVGATSEITGFPNAYTGSAGVVQPAPVVIPTEAGWNVAVVTNSQLYLWDQDGNTVTGFPFTPSAVDASIHTLQAADIDGDGSPELLFRYYNSDLVHVVTLSGSYLTGFPVSTGTAAGRSESVAAIKMSSTDEAMFFCGSLVSTTETSIHGYQGSSVLTGFPITYTPNEMIAIMSTAIFPPVDGVMSIVQGSVYGYITVYDLAVTATETGTIEWQTPYGNPAGNRCYDPLPLVEEAEGPLFVASPTTLDFETLRLDSTRTMSFTVTNNGTEAGDITALAFNDVADGTFSHDATLPITLDPEANTTINVTWTPDAVGDLEGSITITHTEDANGTESTVTLTGTCAVWPDLVFPTEDLAFGTIWDDDPHGSVTFDIENTGNGQGIIDTVTIASAFSSVITVANDFPVTVEPGATTTITLNWAPEDLGDITAGVYVFHNDPAAANGMTELTVTGSYQSDVNEELIPSEYFLTQNYPNPFNPETTIRFGLKEAGQVTLKVYNLNGQEVMSLENGYREAGSYNVSFNGKNLASGVYIYTMKVNEFTSTRKMLLIQ